MEDQDRRRTDKKTARTAGLWYLLLAAGSGYSWFQMAGTYVEGDAAATAGNILTAGPAYLASIAGSIVGQIGFLFLALALFRLFRPTSEPTARLMLAFVWVSVPIMFLNIIIQAGAYTALNRADYLSAFAKSQTAALAMLLVQIHIVGVHVVEVFWGLWLFPFGRLADRSGLFPKILVFLLYASGGAYVAGSLIHLFSPDLFAAIDRYLSLLEAAGEIPMLLWLLIKGVKTRTPGAAAPQIASGRAGGIRPKSGN